MGKFRRSATAALAGLWSASACAVFINEIHYDNEGTDVGEAVELAGAAGTDLAGWTLVFYNGTASSRRAYASILLSGRIPDQESSGFGTLVFTAGMIEESAKSIQNGDPDGLALLAPGQVVEQFLSYGGHFTALDGPAAGRTSTDIGVREPSNTPRGHSLQLAGSGSDYAHFSWSAPGPASFGRINPGQVFTVPGNPGPLPEPASLALAALGLACLRGVRRGGWRARLAA